MDNILSCPMFYTLLYTDILLPPFIHSLIYYTAPHILHHSYILFYIPITYSIIYSLLYTYYYILLYILSTLLYTLIALLILPPPFYTSLILSSLSYILAASISLYPHIVIPTLLYKKGITTLPPIFTRFTSLS